MVNLEEYAKEIKLYDHLDDEDEIELVALLHAVKTKLYMMRVDNISKKAAEMAFQELKSVSLYVEDFKDWLFDKE